MNDSSRRVSVMVTITIFDINDNAPFFEQSMYVVNISESRTTSFLTVVASDRDHVRLTPLSCDIYSLSPSQGTHADFTFTLMNAVNASLPFSISHDVDSGEGRLTVSEALDFETTEQYTFYVSVFY